MKERSIQHWFVIVLGFVLILSFTSPASVFDTIEPQSTVVDLNGEFSSLLSYVPHTPISIDGDSNFSDTVSLEGWDGDGSEGDPFIIENLSINSGGSATPCIYIANTQYHFIIRNCSLVNAAAPFGAGVSLYNVLNGEVTNNFCSNNNRGIDVLEGTENCTISDNTCVNSGGFGILFEDSDYNMVKNNTCVMNDVGIYLVRSTHNIITNNNCSFNTGNGMYFDTSSDNSTITNNWVFNNGFRGIILNFVFDSTISNNTCRSNQDHGIFAHTSNYNLISNNNFSENDRAGLYFYNCRFNNITNNVCSFNGQDSLSSVGSGMHFEIYFQNTTVYNNTCNYNNWHGIYIGDNALNNTLTLNMLANNDGSSDSRGLYIEDVTIEIAIMWNIFVNNFINAEDNQNEFYPEYLYNRYDYNYWSDYGGVDSNNDSIGDTPYIISGSAGYNDSHPLMFNPKPLLRWNETPVDQIIGEDDLLYYKLNVTSHLPTSWAVNDTTYFTIDENGTLESLGTLTEGNYGLNVNVSNVYNFTIQAEFRIIVDGTPPDLNTTTLNLYLEYGEPLYYDLNATDPSGIDTWWLRSGYVSNFSIDSDGVLRNATIFEEPGAIVRIGVNDTVGNAAYRSIVVYVEDTVLPSWAISPENQFIEYGGLFSYDLDATDLAGIDSWWLNRTDFAIDSNGVITNTSLLAEGIYGLAIFCNDTHGNVQSANISLTVEDTVLPSWVTPPENQIIEFGEIFSYDLDATDLAGISHWWVNNTDFSIDGNGLITNATVLSVGIHGLEIFVNDTHGNVQSAIITVTVEAPPTPTTPTSTATTPTTETTTPTLPTTPTGTTPSGLDPMLLLALGGVGAIVVLVIVFVFLKKKS